MTKLNPYGNAIFVRKPPGRLGNMLFMFASAYGIGKHQKRDVYFSQDFKLLPHMFPNLEGTLKFSTPLEQVPKLRISERGSAIFERHLYDDLYEGAVEICCYFQSWKYFSDVESEIRHLLKSNSQTLTRAKNFLQSLVVPKSLTNINKKPNKLVTNILKSHKETMTRKTLSRTIFVGVHIRLGDMTDSENHKFGRHAASTSYILKAMDYFRKKYSNVHFIVCSDDILRAMQTLHFLADQRDVSYSHATDPLLDLTILSQCNHTIMTVGTFGWWGAWLANGETVYYKYQNIPGSALDVRENNADLFPPSWIPME